MDESRKRYLWYSFPFRFTIDRHGSPQSSQNTEPKLRPDIPESGPVFLCWPGGRSAPEPPAVCTAVATFIHMWRVGDRRRDLFGLYADLSFVQRKELFVSIRLLFRGMEVHSASDPRFYSMESSFHVIGSLLEVRELIASLTPENALVYRCSVFALCPVRFTNLQLIPDN